MSDDISSKSTAADDAASAGEAASSADAPDAPSESQVDAADTGKSILSNHKTHLAIGVAATLGIMIFYNWREKRMAKNDPEGYARLQRLKASVRSGEIDAAYDDSVDDPDTAEKLSGHNAASGLPAQESPSEKKEVESAQPS
jgi:hypothetical protein